MGHDVAGPRLKKLRHVGSYGTARAKLQYVRPHADWIVMAPPLPSNLATRLGERIALGDVLIGWRVGEVLPGRLRDRLRPTDVARILDVSVSGAAIIAPYAPEMRPGRPVAIRLGDADGIVRIRRIAEISEPDWRLYGVEFVESDLEIRDWINNLLNVRRPTSEEFDWNRAE